MFFFSLPLNGKLTQKLKTFHHLLALRLKIKMLGTRQLLVAIDFHGSNVFLFFSHYTIEISGYQHWLPTFFKIFSSVFNRREKFIQVWNNMKVSK